MNKFLLLILAVFVTATSSADSRGAFLSAQSMGASFSGDAIRVPNVQSMSLQIIVSSCSSCNGTFKMQMSNAATPTSTDWADIANTNQISTADGSYVWEFKTPSYYWIRPVYTRTAGSGSATGYSSTKDSK